jgi:hypothetical protein
MKVKSNLNFTQTKIEQIGECIWCKREDQSITGSHKFRSLAYQIDYLLKQNIKQAVLSSSGNAAISAAKLLPSNADLKLFVFLSRKTPLAKLAAIAAESKPNLIPILSSKPLRLAKYVIKHFKLKDLRPSKDPNATIGFQNLGLEIFEQKPEIQNIFSFATSGASIRGILESYEIQKKSDKIKKIPKLYAVVNNGKLAGELAGNLKFKNQKCICPVEISDVEILAIKKKYPQIKTSYEGIATLAAAEKIKPVGETLVIFTGKIWKEDKVDLSKFHKAETFADVDRLIKSKNCSHIFIDAN